jgi:hypothetical protein
MKRSTRKLVLFIAIAAIAAVLYFYSRRRKQRDEKAKALPEPPHTPDALGASASSPPASSSPPVSSSPPASASSPPASSATVIDGIPAIYVNDEIEALARVMASEAADEVSQIRIGWVARNRAARRADKSIAAMVCRPCGKQVGNARPFSSARPATKRTRELARQILSAPASADPTKGALNILEPGLQDRLYKAGKTKHSANAVRRRWLRGLDYYGSVAGWDYFGPKGGLGAQPVPPDWFKDEAPPVA